MPLLIVDEKKAKEEVEEEEEEEEGDGEREEGEEGVMEGMAEERLSLTETLRDLCNYTNRHEEKIIPIKIILINV
jgi:hypothetical protein